MGGEAYYAASAMAGGDYSGGEESHGGVECEYNTIKLVQKKSSIPVPAIHGFEASSDNTVGAPFMLMDRLRGNVGMDLGMKVPSEYKTTVFTSMADVHVCPFFSNLSAILMLPRLNYFEPNSQNRHGHRY